MSSSPPLVPLRSPKRAAARSPLQERSRSEANEISSRLVRDTRDDPKTDDFSTPYPTKAAHVLLPSTIRKQRAGHSSENALHAILGPSSQASSFASGSGERGVGDRAKAARPPALTLKRSVATLRDMYEAQAERSRPSTATSPPLRPTTASSIRLRSASSSDGLSGRYAWEAWHKSSLDDLTLLPSLAEATATVKNITSESSLNARLGRNVGTSSPNFVAIGSSSSPRIPVFTDFARTVKEPEDLISSPEPRADGSSSPNVVQLGRSSSFEQDTERSSSPNFVKLGSSSPSNTTTAMSSSSPPSIVLEDPPRKRKREDVVETSFAARIGAAGVVPSSPPYEASTISSSAQDFPSPDNSVALPSSPPKRSIEQEPMEESSPVEHPEKFSFDPSSDGISLADTHLSLQAALTSSPVPAIQYPVVRAPAASAFSGLSIPKRPPRSSADPISPKWTTRLSTVPSEWSGGQTNSKRSSFVEDIDDQSDNGSNYAASRVFFTDHPDATESCIRIVPVPDLDADHHEASDEVSALPGHEFQYQFLHHSPAPPTRHSSFLGTSSYLGTITSSNNSSSRLNSLRNSVDYRLNSMKSFTNSRHNSLQSSSQRPSSSSSIVSNLPIPSWARRYYSGAYRQDFQHMYYSPAIGASNSNISVAMPNSGRPSTATSRRTKRSERSARERFPLNIFRTRPRLEARQSHIEPGIGPLVSNPVRKRLPPPAATYQNSHPHPTNFESDIRTNRTVSLHPADPRAHWAGITPQQLQDLQDEIESISVPPSRHSTLIPRRPRASDWSPHLYRGPRSSLRRSMWHAPSVNEMGEKWFSLRNLQVVLFLLGFVFPISWFVAAFLPLPEQPSPEDLEEGIEEKDRGAATGPQGGDLSMDLEMRIRRQTARADQLRWENTRWWRGLNRFMCAVGLVVIAVVVTLAVLGTRGSGWGH